MKGIIINEGSPLLENKYVNACYIKYGDLELQLDPGEGTRYTLSGVENKSASACCSKKDTYDFETGALIALMRMCGLEKSAKAYAEIFDDTAYGDALIERDKLKEKVDALYAYNKGLIEEIDQQNHEIIALKALKLTNESLKKDNESFRKTCEKYKSAYEIMVEKSADLMDKIKKLEEENEKLKTDCEKLQHGYVDTDVPLNYWDGDVRDIVFLPGRRYGKQYKALVNLFRKLPQDKIEAAYKEVYNTELPAWKKEFLNQMYGIYKESREKTELPKTLDINGTIYRKSIQIKDFGEQIKPLSSLTKREKMWDDILKEGRTPVYVERKDIHDFLEECQVAGIKWQSGKMPLEAAPFDLSEDDGMYFFVMTSRVPNGFRHVMTWWVTAYDEDERKTINYLPPMRWDLFEKGRLVVKVSKENYAEFCSRVFSHFDKVGVNALNHDCKFGYFMFNKDTDYVERILASDCGDTKEINRHKVVDWEDVR